MNKSTKHTDALLRQRLLEELPLASPTEAGWTMLSEKMDADTDLGLQAALTGLSFSSPAQGWQALEHKLDPVNLADADLSDKLNSLQPTPTASGWDVLEARLEKEKDDSVDAIVVDGMARSGVGATSGWAALAARLELIGWRRGVIAAWKITEASLLLSMLLLVVRFGPATEIPGVPIAQAENAFPIPVAAVELITTPDVKEVLLPTKSSATPIAQSVQQQTLIPVKYNNNEADLPQALLTTSIAKIDVAEIISIDKEIALVQNTIVPAAIPSLQIEQLRKSIYLPSPAVNLPEIDNSEPVHYYVNAFVSPFDVNRVVTPATSIGEFDISGDRRFTYGSSVGLLFDVSQGKNGLQIGAIYSRRSYIPTALKWYLQDEYTAFEPIKG